MKQPGRTRLLGTAVLSLVALSTLASGRLDAAKKTKKKASPSAPVAPRAPDPYRVTMTTKDGVILVGSYRPVSGQERAPAVLVLHGFSRDRREWDAFVPELNARGLATLAVDLRGHGESVKKTTGATVPLSPSLQFAPGGFPRDVETAAEWLRARTGRVGAMGLSLSGGLALLATSAGWVETAVAVSVNADRLSLLAGGPVSPRASFLLASQDDPGRADSARSLDAAGAEPKRMLLFPGAAHGLDLFREHPDAWRDVVGWLGARLGAIPPPAPTPVPTATPEQPAAPAAGPSGPTPAPPSR